VEDCVDCYQWDWIDWLIGLFLLHSLEILLHSLDVDTGESLFRMGEEFGLFNSIQNIKGIKNLD
jgi:hypothetical protein